MPSGHQSESRPSADTSPDASRWVLIVGLIITVVLIGGALFFAIGAARERSRTYACLGNLRQLSTALHTYHDLHGSFPPAYVADADGHPLHSWRVLLLPYIGERQLHSQYRFDEPWDGPHNRQLVARMPAVFACPEHADIASGITNYVAVVGKETIWPEQYSATIHEVTDGPSLSVQLLEWPGSDIAWTEPRDVRFGEAEKTRDSSGHPADDEKGSQHILLVDGQVRAVDTRTDSRSFRSLQTINRGLGLPGIVWPVDPRLLGFDFGQAVAADELQATDIVPYRAAPIVGGWNTVWCATFQIAWDEARSHVGEPVLREDTSEMATTLNQESFDRRWLDSRSYVARCGQVSEGIIDQIRREMSARFPGASPTLLAAQPKDDAIIMYCYLRKVLPFAVHFERLDEPLRFRDGVEATPVAGFGLSEEPGDDFDELALRSQVTVLDYSGADDFVLQLQTLDGRDAIVLAQLPAGPTLIDTIESVHQRIKGASLSADEQSFKLKETLAVPVLTMNIDWEYDELIGQPFRSPRGAGMEVERASQVIRFHLDERGAQLESEALPAFTNGHTAPPEPRRFVFDRPFLIWLQERGAEEPYFVAWIGNAELMEQK